MGPARKVNPISKDRCRKQIYYESEEYEGLHLEKTTERKDLHRKDHFSSLNSHREDVSLYSVLAVLRL